MKDRTAEDFAKLAEYSTSHSLARLLLNEAVCMILFGSLNSASFNLCERQTCRIFHGQKAQPVTVNLRRAQRNSLVTRCCEQDSAAFWDVRTLVPTMSHITTMQKGTRLGTRLISLHLHSEFQPTWHARGSWKRTQTLMCRRGLAITWVPKVAVKVANRFSCNRQNHFGTRLYMGSLHENAFFSVTTTKVANRWSS